MKPTALLKETSEIIIPPKKSETNWLAMTAWLVSLFTGTLVLLGYGVSLAAENLFGIPHAAVFDSTFELLDLASIAILEIVPSFTDALNQWTIYVNIYKSQGIIIGLMVVCWSLLAVAGRFWQPKRPSTTKTISNSKPVRLFWGRSESKYWRDHVLVVAFIAFSPLASILAVLVIVAALTALSIVPIIGMTAGKAYINQWVIAPQHCVSPVSLESRRQQRNIRQESSSKATPAVLCVAVMKDGDVIARGRVVFYTSKAVVLVEESGRARRVPTSGAVVEAVSDSSESAAPPDKHDKNKVTSKDS